MPEGQQKNAQFQEPDVMTRWSLLEPLYRIGAALLAKCVYHPVYHHFDRIPKKGAAILICNHVSFVDGLVLQAGLGRSVRFIIDEHIYNTPVVHYFMRHNRAIPILPKKESIKWALSEVKQALNDGDLICIFPEGQLTYTGGLSRFKPGIESIMQQNPEYDVYPLALTGLWGSIFSRKYLNSWFRWWPRHRGQKVQAICGLPIRAEDVTLNRLQQEVLRLKYKIQTPPTQSATVPSVVVSPQK
jgi:1-acyl-sn-glycerol-3-phosphate acyltransferase